MHATTETPTTPLSSQTVTAIACRVAASVYATENAYPSGPELVGLVWQARGLRIHRQTAWQAIRTEREKGIPAA